MKIKAWDEEGREIEKDADIRIVISFGWPCEYSLSSLESITPTDKPLCIDAAGRSHHGSPTYVSAEDVARLVEEAQKAREALSQEVRSSR